MFKKNFGVILAALLPTLLFFTCSAQTTPETSIEAPEKIHFGDLIDVDIVGSTEYDWRGSVNPEGFLSELDFVEEPIFALCRTEDEVAATIAKGYSKLLRDPKVIVKILDRSGRPLSLIYGAVKTPQRLRLDRPARLNEILILSGGLTERAGGEIQIVRPLQLNCDGETPTAANPTTEGTDRDRFVSRSVEGGSITLRIRIADLLAGKSESNPRILSGDIVTVLEAEPIYVIGGAVSPIQISARSQTTLSKVVAAVGGFPKNSDSKKILLYRRKNGETEITNVNLDDIKAGTAEDLKLQAFDTVEILGKTSKTRTLSPVLKQSDIARLNAPNLPLRIIN